MVEVVGRVRRDMGRGEGVRGVRRGVGLGGGAGVGRQDVGDRITRGVGGEGENTEEVGRMAEVRQGKARGGGGRVESLGNAVWGEGKEGRGGE